MIKKGIIDITTVDFEDGEIVLIDKDVGCSSFDVIRNLRKIIGVRKIGHAGTLDPFASGLLILATGKKTKEINRYQNLYKTYTGTITLGKTSLTMDTESEITSNYDVVDIEEKLIYEVRDLFVGKTMQTPPMFSAVKHKGKPLYKYARKGQEVERQPREIFISDFEINKIALPDIYFRLTCSKGTYIRAVAHDFGEKLNCGGILSSLRRIRIGEYAVESAFNLEELKNIFSTSSLCNEIIN